MKKIFIYLTLAFCLVSLFSVSVLASEPDYTIGIQAHNSYGWLDAGIPLGRYKIDVYVSGEFCFSNIISVASKPFNFETPFTFDGIDFIFSLNIFEDHSEAYFAFIDSSNVPSLPGNVDIYISKSIDIDAFGNSLFGVFTDIGDWIVYVLGAFTSIFWTGEQLTFLGILGIAGLCVGIVILFVGLISNFLHFRG